VLGFSGESANTKTVHIRWLHHPEKCLSVKGKRHSARGPHALQIWDCPSDIAEAERFVIPTTGLGKIRWAAHPSVCLNAPGRSNLQFWSCDHSPRRNVEFLIEINSNGSSEIRKAADPRWCVDVPDDNLRNGHMLQMWHCNHHNGQDKHFTFHRLVAEDAFTVATTTSIATSVTTTTAAITTTPAPLLSTAAPTPTLIEAITTSQPAGSHFNTEVDEVHEGQKAEFWGLREALPMQRWYMLMGCFFALGAIFALPFLCCRLCSVKHRHIEADNGADVWRFARVVDARRPYETLSGAYEVQLDGRSGSARDAALVHS